jgi:hypothetical protein
MSDRLFLLDGLVCPVAASDGGGSDASSMPALETKRVFIVLGDRTGSVFKVTIASYCFCSCSSVHELAGCCRHVLFVLLKVCMIL